MRRSIVLSVLILTAACGGTAVVPGTTEGKCVVTLSGGITSSVTLPCSAAGGINSDGKSAFALSLSNATAGFTDLTFGANLPSASFSAGTYGSSSVTDAATVIENSNVIWEQAFNQTGTPDTGTFNLVVSSTGTQYTNPNNGEVGFLNCHGTLDATLPPVTASGATGDVTLHVTF